MKWMAALVAIFLVVFGLTFSSCSSDANRIDTVSTPIGPTVEKIRLAEKYFNKKVQLKTNLFYGAHEYRRAWLGKRRPGKLFFAFVTQVRESADYGLDPQDYQIAELEEAVKALYDNRKRTSTAISTLDIRITASFFLFTTHLIEGRVRYPGAREFFWQRGMPLENDVALLLTMQSAADLRTEIERLNPKNPQYKRLQLALKHYRKMQAFDTLAPLPEKIVINPGDTGEHVLRVRRRLLLTGDYEGKTKTPKRYDPALVEAVKQFQNRHSVAAKGVVDSETAKLLNVTARETADLISLNLERQRWYPHVPGDVDRIVINVPEYMLRVYKKNKETMTMRVVLGAEFTPTPVFYDTLKYLVFSPTWMVPRSIFENEFLPKLQDDPAHFNVDRFRFFKNGKEIDPEEEDWNDRKIDTPAYRVIENPGDANSLGKVKFIMPNNFSVYLHDTPAPELFDRDQRALSHGCIRVEKPFELAQYLLSNNADWNGEKIRRAMEAGEPVKVDLDETWPVYIIYRTVWVDEDGLLHFSKDIYGHDHRQLASLRKKQFPGKPSGK